MTLTHLGTIAVHGDDRRSFLQGQLTSDLQTLSPTNSQLAALCNPQGRVVAVLRLVELDDAICLLLPAETVSGVLARLQRYVLRAKVTLSDHSNTISSLGIVGNDQKYIEKKLNTSLPESPGAVALGPACRVLRVETDVPRWLLLTQVDLAERLAGELGRKGNPDDSRRWQLADLRTGLPVVYPQTQESFLPQMLNLDILESISFTKGCYTGQEIIARTQNLGRIKRRMLRFAVDGEEQPMPGDAVYSKQEKAGDIVTAVGSEDGWELLAVIRQSAYKELLSLDDRGRRVLTPLPLPYSIPELDN